MKKGTLIIESTETKEIEEKREKTPVRWWVDKDRTKISDDGVTVVFRYRPDIGKNRGCLLKPFKFSNEELGAIKLKEYDESNTFGKIGLTRKSAREAQGKFRKSINRMLYKCYRKNGIDEAVELFRSNPDIDYLLRGFALYEAKQIKMRTIY